MIFSEKNPNHTKKIEKSLKMPQLAQYSSNRAHFCTTVFSRSICTYPHINPTAATHDLDPQHVRDDLLRATPKITQKKIKLKKSLKMPQLAQYSSNRAHFFTIVFSRSICTYPHINATAATHDLDPQHVRDDLLRLPVEVRVHERHVVVARHDVAERREPLLNALHDNGVGQRVAQVQQLGGKHTQKSAKKKSANKQDTIEI
jgi:hypothetical protein